MNFITAKLIQLFLLCSVFVTLGATADTSYEEEVITALEKIQHADIDSSILALNNIINQYANSKIGHLVLADIFATRAGSKSPPPKNEPENLQLNGLRDELRYRWQNSTQISPAYSGKIPSNLVFPSADQKYLIAVDASTARLYVYENKGGDLHLADDFYMTVGKSGMGKNLEGDLRTPIGVYHVTAYLPGNALPDRYGSGAFPINYPNRFDKLKNRTGYGIWIHGTETDNYNRVPLASDGCVSLSNDEFLEISRYINTDGSTPVIIAEDFQWISPEQQKQSREYFLSLIKTWKNDWASRNHAKYIRHYSNSDFSSGKLDFESWSDHKRKVNAGKKYITINIENLRMFTYPGEQNMLMMTFQQKYNSDNYQNTSAKTLFWKQNDNNQWKIIYEG